MGLETYHAKRDFERSPEPAGDGEKRSPGPLRFVVQKHAASRLHYDFRLELDGVLLSWAVPKGPSLDPADKRLAMPTEDHPLEYASFEGVIPAQEYGGGTVLVWDRGTWEPEGDPREAYRKGRLRFELHGEKLHGRWNLVRTEGRGKKDRAGWLLIKGRDEAALAEGEAELVEREPNSVLSGRSLEEVASQPDRVWHSNAETGVPDPSNVEGARKAKPPRTFEPQLATLVDDAPKGDGWVHEIKYDGYRLLAHLEGGGVRMLTRRAKDWTERMPALVRTLTELPVPRAVLDGELVVLREDGISDFQALQNALGGGDDGACMYYVFDLLHLGDHDLRRVALTERKSLLQALLSGVGAGEGRVRFCDHVRGHGEAFFENACEMGLEGIISKRADATYRSGRGRDWVKVKCQQRQEFVIGGWTEPSGSRKDLGALLIGLYEEDGRFVYAGKVGTGFAADTLRELRETLAPHERKTPPFSDPPRGYRARGVHWVEPALLAEVEFTGLTEDGRVRHPSFKGLRQDKSPEEVKREKPEPVSAAKASASTRSKRDGSKEREAPSRVQARGVVEVAGVRLSNPDRVLYPERGVTKAELATYYASVAEAMMPHVSARPLTLVRCPSGHDKECFYQKHLRDGMPDAVRPVKLKERSGWKTFGYVEDAEGLVSLVQMGVLEVHLWGSRVDKLERPDQIVMDLDPGPDVPWSRVVDAAREVRERLETIGLASWVKTTGGKGLHVVAPITRRTGWDEVKGFCKALAEVMEHDNPRRYVSVMTKAKRKGRIFVDYLRNGRGATAIAPFSTRARPGAPVATPVRWDELGPDLAPDGYDLRNLPRRLAALSTDPWEGFFEVRQSITKGAMRELGMKV